jgi:hypothetical protein
MNQKKIKVTKDTAYVCAVMLKCGTSYVIRANRTKRGFHERVFELTKFGAKQVPAFIYIMNLRESGVSQTVELYKA